MGFTTIGSIIEKSRLEKKGISRKKLSDGLCSEQRLYEIERDSCESDTLLVDILLQRLGKSPDKLERVLQADMYRMIRLRDLLEEAILRGRKELAERILETYPLLTKVDRMYKCRMRACLVYRIDHDFTGAIEQLQKAIDITLPAFTYEKIEDYLISTVEMENLLALERMKIEGNQTQIKAEEKRNLGILMCYIDKHFTDEEEHAKIYSKCAWLLARVCFAEGDYIQTLSLCEKGIEELRRNTMLYFMFPLLKLMTETEKEIGIAPEKSKWVQYYDVLTFLWERYAKKWYPTDLLFHNCYQKEYHLDYELIRSEREARRMTQEEMADGIYQNVESYSRFETGKASPNKKTFEKLIKKLGIEKGRYNGYAVTDSFETMEIRRNLDRMLSHGEYQKAEEIVVNLKDNLDMTIQENRKIIQIFELMIAKRFERITIEDALEQEKVLIKDVVDFERKQLLRIPMKNEIVCLNQVCVDLEKVKQGEQAEEIYIAVLALMRKSRIHIKYRYRSYALFLQNFARRGLDAKDIHAEFCNELICGKAAVLPLCLINQVKLMEKEGSPQEQCLKLVKKVYYLSDMYFYKDIKSLYGKYLIEQNVDIIF